MFAINQPKKVLCYFPLIDSCYQKDLLVECQTFLIPAVGCHQAGETVSVIFQQFSAVPAPWLSHTEPQQLPTEAGCRGCIVAGSNLGRV